MDDAPEQDAGPGRSLPRRGRMVAAALLAVAVVGGVTIWGVSHPGSYGTSRDGCVTVSMPSSTGGGLMHGCGASARAMCHEAFATHDKLALATRPQCRLAGLAPRPAATHSGG